MYVREREATSKTSTSLACTTCWMVLCDRKYQKRPQCGGLGGGFQILFESMVAIIRLQGVMAPLDWQKYLRILSPSWNPHNSKYINNIIIYIGNYYSREYRLMSSSSLEWKWVIFLYKSRQ